MDIALNIDHKDQKSFPAQKCTKEIKYPELLEMANKMGKDYFDLLDEIRR